MQSAPVPAVSPLRDLATPQPFVCFRGARGVSADWVHVSGDVDIAVVEELTTTLDAAMDAARLVVVDLDGVTFMDSSGIHALEDASIRALLHERRLVIVRPPAHVARLFRLTGTFGTVEMLDFILVGPPERAHPSLVGAPGN